MDNLKELETWFIKALDLPEDHRIGFLEENLKDQPGLLAQLITLVTQSHDSVFTRLKNELSEDGPVVKPEIDKYDIGEELGRGGMAVVYRAKRSDGVFDHEVAIKVLKSGLKGADLVNRFDRERNILAALKHEHITQIYDGGVTAEGSPYFVMEIVNGKDISTYAAEENLTLKKRLQLFLKVCSAIAYAHQNLIIHTDIKPSNVLVNERGEVKLTDFGIAQLIDQADAQSEQSVFTPGFASPEQVNRQVLDVRTDVFQMGMLLKELTKGLKLSQDLKMILFGALQEQIEHRYPSMTAFSADVEALLHQRPILRRQSNPGYVLSKFVARNKVVVSVFVAALLAITSLTYIYIDRLRKANEEILYEKELAEDSFNLMLKTYTQAYPAYAKGDTLTIFDMLHYGDSIMTNSGSYLVKGRFFHMTGHIYSGFNNQQEAAKYFRKSIYFLERDSLGINQERNLLFDSYARLSRTYLEAGNADSAYYFMKLSEKYGEKNELRETLRPLLYSNLASIEWGRGNIARADSLYQQALKMYEMDLKYHLEHAMQLAYYGRLLYNLDAPSNKEQIEALFQKARFIFSSQGYDTTRQNNFADVVNLQGLFYLKTQQYEKAEDNFREAYKVNHELFGDNNLATLDNLNNLALIMTRQERHEEAQQAFLKCWIIANKLNISPRFSLVYYMNYASTFNSLKEYHTASIKLDSVLNAWKGLNVFVLPNTNTSRILLARSFIGLKRYDKAEKVLAEVIKTHLEANGDQGTFDILAGIDLVKIFRKSGREEKALTQYQQNNTDINRRFGEQSDFYQRNEEAFQEKAN